MVKMRNWMGNVLVFVHKKGIYPVAEIKYLSSHGGVKITINPTIAIKHWTNVLESLIVIFLKLFFSLKVIIF